MGSGQERRLGKRRRDRSRSQKGRRNGTKKVS